MLVLSRRAGEKIVFPQSEITVHVLGVRGNVVRIGVEAPPEIKVLREELTGTPAPTAAKPPALSHDLRNRLNKINLLTNLLERQMAAGRTEEAETTVRKLSEFVGSLDQAPPQGKDSAGSAEKRRTLLVEDDANQRELLAGLLNLSGVDCDTAEDGQAALDFLASHERPDFVLLDMYMPRCNGPETVARIRRDPRLADLKVFALSGTPPRDLGLATGPKGVDAWLPKPINPRTIWEAIQKHLGNTSTHN
jgi:carbon storage regulator CsrA